MVDIDMVGGGHQPGWRWRWRLWAGVATEFAGKMKDTVSRHNVVPTKTKRYSLCPTKFWQTRRTDCSTKFWLFRVLFQRSYNSFSKSIAKMLAPKSQYSLLIAKIFAPKSQYSHRELASFGEYRRAIFKSFSQIRH